MKFKLPALSKLVSSNNKLDDVDPNRLIHVVGGHALVINELIVCVDLREYVKKECSIEDTYDLDMLTTILEELDGRSFSKEFWKEFESDAEVSLAPDGFEIEKNSYTKTIHIEELHIEQPALLSLIQDMKKDMERIPQTTATISVPGKHFITLFTAFKKELEGDVFLFDFSGAENKIRYSGRSKDYLFGLIPVDYNSSTEWNAFFNMKEYIKHF